MSEQHRLTANQIGKIIQSDYDEVFSLTGEQAVCLTNGQIQYLLSQADYAGWRTRWFSPTGQQIDKDQITAFMDDLVQRLMSTLGECGEGSDMFLLRQNPENRCQLQQSTDGGLNWTLAFDYALCFQSQNETPPLQQYEETYGGLQTSYDGGSTWVDTPDYRFKDPLVSNIHKDRSDPACYAASNVIEWAKQVMLTDDEQGLVNVIASILALLVSLFSGGIAAPIITALATAIVNLGIEAFQDAMTETEWDKFKKNLYCHANPDGSYTLQAYYAIYDQIQVDHDGLAEFFLEQIMGMLGYVGLNNSARMDMVESPDCSEINCGNEDCGFTTTHVLNRTRWELAEELFDVATFEKPIGGIIQSTAPVFSALGTQTLAVQTILPELCYITEVVLYTQGRSNPSNIAVGYKTALEGEWQSAGIQSPATWPAGVPKVFTINAPIRAIQIQSEAFNSGQNNFIQVTISDPTP